MANQMQITNFLSRKNPKFVCDECGYSSDIKVRLIDHVNSVHLNKDSSGDESEDTSLVPLAAGGNAQADPDGIGAVGASTPSAMGENLQKPPIMMPNQL